MQSSSLYLERASGLHAWHPLTKLALLGLALVMAFSLPSLAWLLAAYLLLLLPLAAWGGVLRPFASSSLKIILPFVISLAVIQGFFAEGSTTLFTVFRWEFTSEGLLAGMTVAARLLVALGGTLLLMLATRPDKLMLALTERGLPQALGYIVLTALQIFPRFQDRARVITDAQQARGLELQVNPLKRLGLLLPLIGPLILGSIVDVEERALALEARAFSHPGQKTSLIELNDSQGQTLLRWALLLVMLALIAYRLLAAGERMIQICGLNYRYPQTEVWALEGIDLEIPAGQFCGVVGANGAGKSTLCYALSGFVPHFYRGKYEGQVRIGDKLVAESTQGELAGLVGLVLQNPFNQISGARFTVREEIAFGLENLGLPRPEIEARVKAIIEETELTELAERSPFALSGGQQQRVAIASIMAMRPQVLVLDEPTSQLDPRGTEDVFANLNTLAEEHGTTVILVEHKLEWLAAHCDRVLALDQGRVVADGRPQEVLTRADLIDYGIGGTQYTLAARQAQLGGLVESQRPLPVTLDEAKDWFQ